MSSEGSSLSEALENKFFFVSQLEQTMNDEEGTEDIKLSWMKQSDGKVFHKEEKRTKKEKNTHKKDEL